MNYTLALFLRDMKWASRVITLRLLYDTSYDDQLSQEDASTITPTALKRMLVQQQCPKTIIALDLTAPPYQIFLQFGLFKCFAKQTIPRSFVVLFFFCIILWIFLIFIIVQFCTVEFFFSLKKKLLIHNSISELFDKKNPAS